MDVLKIHLHRHVHTAVLKTDSQQEPAVQPRDSAQCYMPAWMAEGFGGEETHVCMWLSPSAIHLNYHNTVNWLYSNTKKTLKKSTSSIKAKISNKLKSDNDVFSITYLCLFTKTRCHDFTIDMESHSTPTSRSNYPPFIDEDAEASTSYEIKFRFFCPQMLALNCYSSTYWHILEVRLNIPRG